MASNQALELRLTPTGPSEDPRIRTILLASDSQTLQVGRSSRSEVKNIHPAADNAWFDSPVMSRSHAEISFTSSPQAVYVTDTASMHGSFIDSKRLEKHVATKIKNGAIIKFGCEVSRGLEVFPARSFCVEFSWNSTRPITPDSNPATSNRFSVPDSDDNDVDEEAEASEDSISEDEDSFNQTFAHSSPPINPESVPAVTDARCSSITRDTGFSGKDIDNPVLIDSSDEDSSLEGPVIEPIFHQLSHNIEQTPEEQTGACNLTGFASTKVSQSPTNFTLRDRGWDVSGEESDEVFDSDEDADMTDEEDDLSELNILPPLPKTYSNIPGESWFSANSTGGNAAESSSSSPGPFKETSSLTTEELHAFEQKTAKEIHEVLDSVQYSSFADTQHYSSLGTSDDNTARAARARELDDKHEKGMFFSSREENRKQFSSAPAIPPISTFMPISSVGAEPSPSGNYEAVTQCAKTAISSSPMSTVAGQKRKAISISTLINPEDESWANFEKPPASIFEEQACHTPLQRKDKTPELQATEDIITLGIHPDGLGHELIRLEMSGASSDPQTSAIQTEEPPRKKAKTTSRPLSFATALGGIVIGGLGAILALAITLDPTAT